MLLSARRGPARGVEIFNLRLIRDLAVKGDELVVPVHSSWRESVAEYSCDVRLIPADAGRNALMNGILAVMKLRRERHDVVLLANVSNGLLPAVALMRAFGVARRCVLIAHREPSRRFLRGMRMLPTRVIAVNGIIADQFREAGHFECAEVYYGVTDADAFQPRRRLSDEDGIVRFCVIGQLDNAWKGADTAAAAFNKAQAGGGFSCELHLASFSRPDSWKGPGIVPYGWMDPSSIPEFLGRMDVMIVPSRDEEVMRETFSQAMVQGMLSGLPTIVNQLPVLTEKLDEGGGLVFSTVDELAACIRKMANSADYRRETGARGRATALSRYKWSTDVFREKYLA